MIIQVNPVLMQAIEGVAKDVAVSFYGDDATMAISSDNLIAMPVVGQKMTLAGEVWEVVRAIAHTNKVLAFLRKRTSNARAGV